MCQNRKQEEWKLELQCPLETVNPESISWMNRCGSHGAPVNAEATPGPPWGFLVSVWEIYVVLAMGGTSLCLCQIYGGTSIYGINNHFTAKKWWIVWVTHLSFCRYKELYLSSNLRAGLEHAQGAVA